MISKIKGKIDDIIENKVILELNGIFYEILVPSSNTNKLNKIKKKKEKVLFYTLHYIETGFGGQSQVPKLIGFLSSVEREFFEKYTTVKGLGIKNALKSLAISVKDIATYIENSEVAKIMNLPGIGKRTAEKIVVELRGKVAKFALINESSTSEKSDIISKSLAINELEEEVTIILKELGYNQTDCKNMFKEVMMKNPEITEVEKIIQEIFKNQKNRKKT